MGSVSMPQGFVYLEEAMRRPEELLNTIGIVTDFLPPSKTRGSDYQCTFTITDGSRTSDPGLKVKFFRPEIKDLPTIQSTGDVVALYYIKIKPHYGTNIGLSTFPTEWTVLPYGSIQKQQPAAEVKIQHTSSRGAQKPSSALYYYAVSLCKSDHVGELGKAVVNSHEMNGNMILQNVGSVGSTTSKRKFSLLKDLQDQSFYDLIGQVVRKFSQSAAKVDIYVTDYTEHNLLFDYKSVPDETHQEGVDGDIYGYHTRPARVDTAWPGPYGKMTLQVTLWPPHSYYAQEHVKEGEFVFLKNVTTLYNQVGIQSRLEGALHTARWDPNEVLVSVLTDRNETRVKEVLGRKRAYLKKIEQQRKAVSAAAKSVQRQPAGNTERGPDGRVQEETRAAKRRRKKGPRKANRNGASEVRSDQRQLALDLNPSVRSNNPTVETMPLSIIAKGVGLMNRSPKGVEYELPFHNICCRARARVVDFFPPDLADFAVPMKISEFDVLTDCESDESDTESSRPSVLSSKLQQEGRWEWRFCLLLEDAAPRSKVNGHNDLGRLKVYVVDHDAECLLQLNAEDLRSNPTALVDLREKLFLLWGDLEERKSAQGLETTTPVQKQPESDLSKKDASRAGQAAVHQRQNGHGSSGRVFECCLKEYGVRVNGSKENKEERWERRFRMFGTSIL